MRIHDAQRGGLARWLDAAFWLDTYAFEAGKGARVLAATGNGSVVADALKWVSVACHNDGSQVSQVTLQPCDGIVLLSSCYVPGWRDCLPLAT